MENITYLLVSLIFGPTLIMMKAPWNIHGNSAGSTWGSHGFAMALIEIDALLMIYRS
jgi:hypothetical protein